MTKKQKNKKRNIIIIIVLLLVAAAIVAGINFSKNAIGQFGESHEPYTVTTGNIDIMVTGSGSVESLDTKTHYAEVAGQVDELEIENGDIVATGDILAVLDSSTIEAKIDTIKEQITNTQSNILSIRSTTGSSAIKSPASGVVKAIYAKEDDDINSIMENYNSLALISIDGRMKADVIGLDTSKYKPGNEVEFIIGAESVKGNVYIVENNTVTFTVIDDEYEANRTIQINDINGNKIADARLKVNMPLEIVAYEGIVRNIKIEIGDEVGKNDILISRTGKIPSIELTTLVTTLEDLQIDLDEAEADLNALVIIAEIDGIITGLKISKNSIVDEGAELYTIQTTNEIMLEIEVDELDISKITIGQDAQVKVDALDNQTFGAIITKINPIGFSVNNVTNYITTLQVNSNEDILIGMSATADILIDSKENIIIIPIESIQIIDGEKYVLMANEIGVTTEASHSVETGVSDGLMIEITSGLTQNDIIATPKSTSNLDMMRGPGNFR